MDLHPIKVFCPGIGDKIYSIGFRLALLQNAYAIRPAETRFFLIWGSGGIRVTRGKVTVELLNMGTDKNLTKPR